jgi:hypothetical protein
MATYDTTTTKNDKHAVPLPHLSLAVVVVAAYAAAAAVTVGIP